MTSRGRSGWATSSGSAGRAARVDFFDEEVPRAMVPRIAVFLGAAIPRVYVRVPLPAER